MKSNDVLKRISKPAAIIEDVETNLRHIMSRSVITLITFENKMEHRIARAIKR